MKRVTSLTCLLLSLLIVHAVKRPNIVVLFADDMGYSDIGCFGSEIETPNLDGLAANGLRFTHFYNTGRCCPSRASILTGLYSHQADIGHMAGETGVRGYRDRLSFNAVTLAEVLGSAGYHTIMTGKWHLGWRDEGSPTARGFQHFYGTRGYIDSYFTIVPRTEIYLGEELVIPVTDKPINHLHPDQEWYTTDVFTDYAIHFIDEVRKQDDKPFFLYLAYNAPHFPLHAKPEDTKKYRGRYRDGWEGFRKNRHERLKELGMLNKSWPLSALDVPKWETLTEQQRDDMDFKMALFAAIIDRLDQNVGRVVDHLKKIGELDNTLLVFVSDNGGTKETGLFGIKGDKHTVDNYKDWARVGGWSSSYGQGWANLSNTPFREYKRENHEGGVSAPFVIHWPKGFKAKGELRHQVAHLIDLMPTFVEVSGAKYPKSFKGKPIQEMEGRSLVPFLDSKRTESRTLFWEHEGNRAVREGAWKLVGSRNGPWELYDASRDRTELNNLASAEPQKFASLKKKWDDWAKRVHVMTPEEYSEARKAFRRAAPLKGPTVRMDFKGKPLRFMNKGVVVDKKAKPAWQFNGKSWLDLPRDRAPGLFGSRTIRYTGRFHSKNANGVILAHGGDRMGLSVYLSDGKLSFAQCADWKRKVITSTRLGAGEHSFEAVRHADGRMTLSIDGGQSQSVKAGLIGLDPGDSLQIGADTVKPVGEYEVPNQFNGTIRDLKIEVERVESN
ncbi:MAG: arylsulfatase [Verrucomicrobiales bacterium]|nr:arylsulfatase [Verrucomicrobiales bacterium]